jgi:hypothetical protein
MSSPSNPRARLLDGVLEPPLSERVLAPQVDVAALAARCVSGDRHRLDHRERVSLEDHAILERPRLGLIGIADQIVRAAGLAGDSSPEQIINSDRRQLALERCLAGLDQ